MGGGFKCETKCYFFDRFSAKQVSGTFLQSMSIKVRFRSERLGVLCDFLLQSKFYAEKLCNGLVVLQVWEWIFSPVSFNEIRYFGVCFYATFLIKISKLRVWFICILENSKTFSKKNLIFLRRSKIVLFSDGIIKLSVLLNLNQQNLLLYQMTNFMYQDY